MYDDGLPEKADHKNQIGSHAMDDKTFMMYVIGISGSGKTTIANALEKELKIRGLNRLQVIDGDVIRSQFGGIFGYTYEERMKCNQAVRVVVQYLLDNGINVILTQVAAYEEMRARVRNQFGDKYIEVYVKCSHEECARRDVKGYYKLQKDGLMQNLNGTDDVYEEPKHSHIVIDTEKENVEQAVGEIVEYLRGKNYVV